MSKREMLPPSLTTDNSGGPAALLTSLYDHKPSMEFRAEHQGLGPLSFQVLLPGCGSAVRRSLGDLSVEGLVGSHTADTGLDVLEQRVLVSVPPELRGAYGVSED